MQTENLESTLKKNYGCEVEHHGRPADHDWTEHLVDRVQIRSRTRGRIRFFIDIEGDEILHDSLRREVSRVPSGRLTSYNYQTGTALVHFDPKETNSIDVTTALFRAVTAFGRKHADCVPGDSHTHTSPLIKKHLHNHSHQEQDCDHDHGAALNQKEIRRELTKFGLTGAALGYFIWRRLTRGTPALAGGTMGVVASIVTVASGYPILRGGVKTLGKGKKLTDDTLISIAVLATLLMRENITGLSVVWLINLGRLLEVMTLRRSREEIKRLLDVAPDEAWLVPETGVPVRVETEAVRLNDTIRVFKADQIPLDGTILDGQVSVIESHLNGEPIPKLKRAGDKVYAGSIVDTGECDIRVTSLVDETVIARIVNEIERLRDTKAPIEKVGTKFASKFVPISLGISAIVYATTGDWRRAITALVIACPCAAGLATPTAVSAGIGQSARRGILVKGGVHLEQAAKVDVMVFDKTGTLTQGFPQIVDTHRLTQEFSEDELLALTASLERYSQHPLGKVIVSESEKRGLKLQETKDYKLMEGQGVTGTVGGHQVTVGKIEYVLSETPSAPKRSELEALVGKRPVTQVAVAVNGVFSALFLMEDPLRPNAQATIHHLRKKGFKKILLLSGDSSTVVEYVGKQLGVDEAIGDMLPKDKYEKIEALKQAGYSVAMVGDGVNDAQALAAADLSLAMAGGGSDLAIDVADITIARDDISLIPPAVEISKHTLSTIKTNFVASIGVNMIGLAFGASGNLSPFAAAIVHNLSTIAVVSNSMAMGARLKMKGI